MALLLSFGWSSLIAQHQAQKKIEQEFQKMLEQEDVHNGFLQIRSGDAAIDWTLVDGAFQDGTPVSEANPFHSTSVGKMLTATLTMKLVEESRLKLDDAISKHLPAAIIEGLHVYEGKDYSASITIAQLLGHTSGLPDYIMDAPEDGSPNMMTLLFQNPDRFWEIKELLAFSKANLKAHFQPGKGYYYTDTEYILLGLIIEEKYQKELHQILLDKLFKPLGLLGFRQGHDGRVPNPGCGVAQRLTYRIG